MINIFILLISVSIPVIVFCCHMLVRNEKVYEIRKRILKTEPVIKGLALHGSLPTYDVMLHDFKNPLTYEYWLSYAEEQLKIKNK